ncbi:MAG: hypothetical protein PVF58_13580 [Candidatus Methanofastidiosia archaeon]
MNWNYKGVFMRVGFLVMVCVVFCGMVVSEEEEEKGEKEEFDIEFVGTVNGVGDTLTVSVDEVMATAAEDICGTVKVSGNVTAVVIGDTVHVKGFYNAVNCTVSVEAADHFVYIIPEGAELEKLPQYIEFTGEILRIYEMQGEEFADISVEETVVVTYQEKETCRTVTVKIRPVVGEVEEGLEPGDTIEFAGSYDETACECSLGWYDNFLRKEKKLGITWVLILGGFLVYMVMRKIL